MADQVSTVKRFRERVDLVGKCLLLSGKFALRIREEFFGKKGPASTLVEISSLAHPDWMIEIEAIAVL